jgi:hemerythrin superfamily protein
LCQYPEVTTIEIPRPTSGDVVALILADHRLFEDLLHLLRDETQDRVAVRAALADLLAAHAEAEERHVYPALVRKRAVDEDDVEHSTHEHLEVNEALVGLLEVTDVRSEDFDEAVENLTRVLAHHLDEEEREILNPARTDVPEDTRAELGARFADERNRQLDAGAGALANVSRLIDEERKRASA